MIRQIGIARILTTEYGIDFNGSNKLGRPDYFLLCDRCDSTESFQSLIIEFIKEFKIDFYRLALCVYTALNYVMLHKLFTVVKFLVEECKVDVNCVCHGVINGSPLHMAYSISEESIAQYLIEHGADQDAFDSDGRKPIDYKLYMLSKTAYACASQSYIKRRVLKEIFLLMNTFIFKDCVINKELKR